MHVYGSGVGIICITTRHIYIYGKTIYLFELKIIEILSMTLRKFNVSLYGLYRRLVCIITSGSPSLRAKTPPDHMTHQELPSYIIIVIYNIYVFG